jgi:hypothetical protein
LERSYVSGLATLTLFVMGPYVNIHPLYEYVLPTECVTIALDSAISVIFAEKIVNGGFETGDLTGWTAGGAEVSTEEAHSGTYSCWLGMGCNASIEQILASPVFVNEIYSFGLWIYPKTDGTVPAIYIEYSGGGSTQYIPDCPENTWTYVDLVPYLEAGRAVSGIEIQMLTDVDWDTFVDDISLRTITDTVVENIGYININGAGSGCLPDDFVDAIVLGASQTLEWIPDPNYPDFTFDHWEVICGDITITDTNANPTTFTMNSGTLAWIRAVFVDLVDYAVNVSTNIDNYCCPAYITIGGVQYITPHTYTENYGDQTTTASAYPTGMYANDHEFAYWIPSGGVSVDDIYAVSTIIHITGNGSLQAFYRPIEIQFDSENMNDSCDHSLGSIYVVLTNYPYSLPQDWVPCTIYGMTDQYLRWSGSSGKVFDHWECTGGVSIGDIYSQITTITFTGSGTFKAMYKDA